MRKYFFSPLFLPNSSLSVSTFFLAPTICRWVCEDGSTVICQRDLGTTDLVCKEKSFHRECLKRFSDDEETEKILVKTIFRRSRAFTELGYQLRALNDISFCLRNQVNATGNANNVLFNYWEVGIICKNTGSPSGHGENIRVCMGIFTIGSRR